MFHDELRVVGPAVRLARALGHDRTGSEHLLLAMTTEDDRVADVLATHGATPAKIRAALDPTGAAAAVDRDVLGVLGIQLADVPQSDRPVREPLSPLGMAAARRRCARLNPPLGLDAQAGCAASLRLALARRERDHRPEHLALALVTLDPGVAWVLARAGVDRELLRMALAAAFPPPHRNPALRADRVLGRRPRCRAMVRRYQQTTGRIATAPQDLATVI